MAKNAQNEKQTLDLAVVKDETVDAVLSRVQQFQSGGELHLPANYSAANALKSAWLILQNTVDKDKNPVLHVCTRASIANCLLDMVVQGLNPAKSQCYFIAYGRVLTLSRSYQGNKAICLRVDTDLYDIHAECVYEGDKLEYSIVNGQRQIKNHEQALENVVKGKIIAAYCIAIKKDGSQKRTELMTMDEIKAAWAQSRMNPVTDKGNIRSGTTHDKFTAEMAKKTVTNRMTKHIIGMSDDSTLGPAVAESITRTDDLNGSAYADNEVEKNANQGDVIDIKSKTEKPAETAGPQATKKKPAPDPDQENGGPMTDEEKAEIEAEETAAALQHQAGKAVKEQAQKIGGKAPF